jgi:hypothetical protein
MPQLTKEDFAFLADLQNKGDKEGHIAPDHIVSAKLAEHYTRAEKDGMKKWTGITGLGQKALHDKAKK